MLLPYGVIEYPTWIFSTNQQWLFPFWYFIHDYGVWLGNGVWRFLYPFPWYDLPLVLLGLLWFVLGLSTSRLLHEFYTGQFQRLQVVLLLVGAFVSQIIITSLVLLYVHIYGADVTHLNPLPVHTLLVLLLAAFVPERSAE
jgi:hypothetical protein